MHMENRNSIEDIVRCFKNIDYDKLVSNVGLGR